MTSSTPQSRRPLSGKFTLGLILFVFAGCRSQEAPPPAPAAADNRPLRLLVLDDANLAAAIEQTWRTRSEAPLDVRQVSSNNFGEGRRLDADAVIYPSGLLGELAERNLLLPLTDDMQSHPQLNQHDVLDMVRLREIRWGEAVYAVAFGSPVYLLAYRQDVLHQAGLQPPATWEEYQRLVAHLGQRENLGSLAPPPSQPWFGTAEPWGPGWAGQTLLARAASSVRHHNQYSDLFDFTSMKPLIDGPPYVRALEQMVAAAAHSPPENNTFSPHDAYRALAKGQTALAICWPEPSSSQDAGQNAEAQHAIAGQTLQSAPGEPEIRWIELPGSREVYSLNEAQWEPRGADEPIHVPLLAASGRLGSVTRESSRAKAALHVLAVLSGEWSSDIATRSSATTLYRQSHLASPAAWYPEGGDSEAVQSYAAVAHASLTRGVWMFSPRIPGRARYLDALDAGVRQALAGEATAQEALTDVAEKWREITADLGPEQQTAAYERSLGLEP